MTLSRIRRFVPVAVRQICRKCERGLHQMRWGLGRQIATCHVGGVTIKLGVSSEMELFRARTYSTKEPQTLQWIADNLRSLDVLFDIGANIGIYALFAAKLNSETAVYAFEPESQNYARFCNNIVLNCIQNIVPCCIPLTDTEKFDMFHVSTWEAGAALHSFGGVTLSEARLRQGSLATSLDTLVFEYGVPKPNLIKLDVDGLEESILAGSRRVLKEPALRSLLVEVNTRGRHEDSAVVRALLDAGFRIMAKSDWEFMYDDGATSRNIIFNRA